jgi:hypothetical protein
MSLARSSVQNPSELHSSIETDEYHGPTGGTSYQKGFRTSQEGAGQFEHEQGTGFTSKNLSGGRRASLGATNRSSLVNWDAGAATPSFNQNS